MVEVRWRWSATAGRVSKGHRWLRKSGDGEERSRAASDI